MRKIESQIRNYFNSQDVSIESQDRLLNSIRDYVASDQKIVSFPRDRIFYDHFKGLKKVVVGYKPRQTLETIDRIKNEEESQRTVNGLWEKIKKNRK